MGNVAPNAINVSLFKKLPFDPVADFAPVSLVAITPNILVVHPSVPARTPQAIVARLQSAPERELLIAQGFEPVGNAPAEFLSYIGSEIAKWGRVVRNAGIRPE